MKQIMAVRDMKVEAFMDPMTLPAVGAAIRAFTDAVNGDKNSDIAKHPADFDLFHLGTYDEMTGKIVVFDQPKHVINGEGAKNV